MVWYFLAGFIAGAVGVLKLSQWLIDAGRIDNNDERSTRDQEHMDRDV